MILPLFLAFGYSLTNWDGASPSFDVIGFDNYVVALADPRVQNAFFITTAMAVGGAALLNVIALPLAVLLDKPDRLTRVYRSIVFFPIVLSAIVVGFIWQTLLNTNGIVNQLLEPLGIGPIIFLGEPVLAVISVTGVAMWQTLGFLTVLYLASLKTVPEEVYEAARIDGASSSQIFARITMPILAPAILSNVLIILIFFMRIYEYVVAMTGGGPAGATQSVAFLVVRQSFVESRYGYGSATAILLLLAVITIIVAITTISSALNRRRNR